MIRFLRANAELIISICVVISLGLGCAILYLRQHNLYETTRPLQRLVSAIPLISQPAAPPLKE